MDLHPNCAALGFLIGTWKGRGTGDYPTIERFEYLEEVVFGHVGKPFLSYTQRTRHAVSGEPLHAESGYFRCGDGGGVELVLVQPSGIVEMHHGRVDGHRLDLTLDAVHTTASAKSVTDVRREISVDASTDAPILTYDVHMAAVQQPMTHHLHASLTRQPGD